MMLIGLFQDRECQPLQSYLAAHNMEFMRWKLRKIIDSNERLKYIMLRQRRKDPRLVREALDIIRGLKDDSDSNKKHNNDDSNKENQNNNNCDCVDDGVDAEQERTIFDFQYLKRVADGLDFEARPRRSRDGESTDG